MRPSPALLAVAALLSACGPSATSGPELGPIPEGILAPGPRDGRLPTDVQPLAYHLELRLVPGLERFQGRAAIRVRLAEARDTLWMHGRALSVTDVQVQPADGSPVRATWEETDGDGMAVVRLERAIGPGEATVRLRWGGDVRDDHEGLFGVEEAGRDYLFTQLEPLMARHVFPCFDEPSFKTPFDIELTVPEAQVAVANTRAVDVEHAGHLKTVRFATTEPMPTYLVAFAVGPLDVVEVDPIPPNGVRERPLPLRGVAAKGRGPEMAWTLAQTPALLELVEGYFGTPHPYDKLDVIAIPGFAGAMENVGAITFSESLLFVDPDNSSPRERRWFAYTMAHELSHQWFGNLVTMDWWDDLWLNEAFASWMEAKIVGRWKPEWHAERDRVQWILDAMDADRLASARYVRQPIESEHDIHNAFDFITYVKGAAVLAMFEQWLGEDVFRRGIRRYLDAHRWGSATALDLVAALEAESDRDVSGPIAAFLTQSGIPMIEASLECPEDGPAVLSLSQSRYLPVGSHAEPDRRWQIPMCVAFGTGGERHRACSMLAGRTGRIELPAVCPDWVMPNAGALGYYRWTLGAETLEALRTRGLGHLEPTERMALADNLEAAFDSARTPGAEVLAAVEPLARDDDAHVAAVPMELLSFVVEYVVTDAERPRAQRWIDELYAPRLRRLGWEARPGEPQDAAIARAAVVEHLALVAEDPGVRREAIRRARRYLGADASTPERDSSAVDPGLLPTVLKVAAQEGDAELFATIERHLDAVEDSRTRRNLVVALGSFRDSELAARARAVALDGRLRSFERLRLIDAQMDDRVLRPAAWDWLREHVDELTGALTSETDVLALTRAAGWLCSREHADQVRDLFTGRLDRMPGAPRRLAGAVERIELCAARVEAQSESVRAMFAAP